MNVIIVIAMQGTPPRDFPQDEIAELFTLHTQLEHTYDSKRESLKQRHAKLDKKIRNWPRTEHSDPLVATSQHLSEFIKQVTGHEVIVAFSEYISPSVDEALDLAIKKGADKVVVTSTIMACTGAHSEVDIAAAIERAQARHARIPIVYAWPFEISEVARFLTTHISRFMLGEVADDSGYSLSALTVEDPATRPGVLYEPQAGKKPVAVEFIVGNVSGEQFSTSWYDATLVDAEGFAYRAEGGVVDGVLESLDLNPGEKVRGWSGFIIPEDSTPASLKYEFDYKLMLQVRLAAE